MIDEFEQALRKAAPGSWLVWCYGQVDPPHIISEVTRIHNGKPDRWYVAMLSEFIHSVGIDHAVQEVIQSTRAAFHEPRRPYPAEVCRTLVLPLLERLQAQASSALATCAAAGPSATTPEHVQGSMAWWAELDACITPLRRALEGAS